MKGFQISIQSSQLLDAVTKVNIFKGDYILLEATNRFQPKQTAAGVPFFRMAMRFSKTASNGSSYIDVDCNYMSYDAVIENEGTEEESISKTYSDDPRIEECKAVFDPSQLTELAKLYGDTEEWLQFDCFMDKSVCTVKNKGMKAKERLSSDITIPMVDKALDSGLNGGETFAEATVNESELKKVSSESQSISDADEVHFCFGESVSSFIADRKMLSKSIMKTIEYKKRADAPAYYAIKASDFRSITGSLSPNEKVTVSIKGNETPRYYEFTSVDTGATYTLPIYKEPKDCKAIEGTLGVLNRANRNISVTFDRKDFSKAVSLLQIGYTEQSLRLALEDGDKITVMQAKGGKKQNSTSFAGTVKISGRAKYGEHFDPAEGPVYVDFYAKSFSATLKGLSYKDEEKGNETVRLSILDCVTVFKNVDVGDTLFMLNFLSPEQQVEFKNVRASVEQSAKAGKAEPVKAPAPAKVAEPADEVANEAVTDESPEEIGDDEADLEQRLA